MRLQTPGSTTLSNHELSWRSFPVFCDEGCWLERYYFVGVFEDWSLCTDSENLKEFGLIQASMCWLKSACYQLCVDIFVESEWRVGREKIIHSIYSSAHPWKRRNGGDSYTSCTICLFISSKSNTFLTFKAAKHDLKYLYNFYCFSIECFVALKK